MRGFGIAVGAAPKTVVGPRPVSALTVSWVRVPGRDRSRWRVAPRRRSRPGRFSGWAAQARENPVEREEAVPDVDGPAEAGDRACRPARRPVGRGGVPGAPDLGEPVLCLAREAARGWQRAPRREG